MNTCNNCIYHKFTSCSDVSAMFTECKYNPIIDLITGDKFYHKCKNVRLNYPNCPHYIEQKNLFNRIKNSIIKIIHKII